MASSSQVEAIETADNSQPDEGTSDASVWNEDASVWNEDFYVELVKKGKHFSYAWGILVCCAIDNLRCLLRQLLLLSNMCRNETHPLHKVRNFCREIEIEL